MSDSERPQTTFSGELEPGAGLAAPALDEWTAAAQASLGETPLAKLTKTLPEGVAAKPLYTAADAPTDPGLPGAAPFTRGRTALGAHLDGWEVCPLYDHPDPAVAARQMEHETRRGASAVWVRLDQSARLGLDPDHPRWAEVAGDGVLAFSADDIDRLFEPVEVRGRPVRFEAGGATLAAAALYLAAARRHRLEPAALSGSFELDPLGALAADSELALGLDRSLALLPELARWAAEHAPRLRTVTVSTMPYHSAGATATQELAIALATGVEYLRILEGAALRPDAACDRLRFVFAVGRDLFVEVAKLRAFRRLWWQVMNACGAGDAAARVEVHAATSPRTLSKRDPWVNMLRGTVESFAAAVGGADVLTTLPFDGAIGPADELGRRIALNTQTILREESHVHRVVDPAGGSWYVERLTEDLATAAWTRFQQIEGEGGMRTSFTGDRICARLAETLAARRTTLAKRVDPVTGVSTWPNLSEAPVERPAPDLETLGAAARERLDSLRSCQDASAQLAALAEAARQPGGDGRVVELAVEAAAAGASIGQLATALAVGSRRNRIVPLPAEREGEMFERLRDASDRWLAAHGVRPRVFLATMGPVPEHKPRATFAKSFLEAGGIETVAGDALLTVDEAVAAFRNAATDRVAICSSDRRYADEVPALAAALKAAGARTVLLAGRPGEHEAEWREAGVDHFLFLGCDVHDSLAGLLREMGVLS